MDFFFIILFLILGINIFSAATQRPKKRSLQSKITTLGILRGKSAEHIVSILGAPELVAEAAGGRTQMCWSENGHTLTLLFDGGNCAGRAAGSSGEAAKSAAYARRHQGLARPRPRRMARSRA